MAAMVAGLLGMALQLQQPVLWSAWLYGVMLALVLISMVVTVRARWARPWMAWVLMLVLGFAWTGTRATLRLTQALSPGLVGQTVVVSGVVAQLPRWGPQGVSFRFEVDDAQWRGQPVAVPSSVSLRWGGGWQADGLTLAPPPGLRAGQRWRFEVQLQPPLGAMNPHGFDLELWLFEQGLLAQGRVLARGPAAVATLLGDTAKYPLERARGVVRDALWARVNDPRVAGVLAGLALGDQAAIDHEDWDLFRRTGVAHLLAVSGLHITLLAWAGGAALCGMWRRWPQAVQWRDAPTAGRWGGLGVAVLYALFSGWGIPAQRTVVMLAVVTVLRSRAQRWPALMVCGCAAWVVAWVDPWALLQAGFWLSFAAVALLMLEPAFPQQSRSHAASWPRRLGRVLVTGVRTQWRATWGLAPLSMVFFHQVSVVGFVANLVAIPWVSFVVTPLALLGAVWPMAWDVGAGAVQGLMVWLTPLGAWPDAVWQTPAAPWWAQALCGVAVVLGLAPLPWRVRILAWPLALPMVWPVVDHPEVGQFELVAADVGQGTAVLVRTARHALLFDAGPRYSATSDAGGRVLAPLLTALGHTTVDTLMLSHSDVDHVGGAASLLRVVPAKALWSSLSDDHPLQTAVPVRHTCVAGQSWSWDGVRFEVLHPRSRDLARHRSGYTAPNTVSCVLRVQSAHGHSALLTGDIEAAQEWDLVRRQGEALRSDVLIVPHHGSKTSSTEDFLDTVAPRWAVIQAGWRNRYGHPAPAVLARYVRRGMAVISTPACGAWTWRAGQAQCERDQRRRYWHTRLNSESPGGSELAQPVAPKGFSPAIHAETDGN